MIQFADNQKTATRDQDWFYPIIQDSGKIQKYNITTLQFQARCAEFKKSKNPFEVDSRITEGIDLSANGSKIHPTLY